RGENARARAAAMARESEGNPFFVGELARHADSDLAGEVGSESIGLTREVSLDGVLRARVARLTGPARRLLEVVAVAGMPVAQGVAARTAGLVGGSMEARESFKVLRGAHLVRTRGARDEDMAESYHDR